MKRIFLTTSPLLAPLARMVIRFRFGTALLLGLTAAVGAVPSLADTHDITSYGATANNGSDDTAAINSAINAASAGDTVYFPAGTFDISGTVNGKSGVTLAGAGQASTTLKKMGTTVGPMIGVSGKSNVTIRDMTINGNSSSFGNGIEVTGGSSNILVSSMAVRDIAPDDAWGPHGVIFYGATDSEVSDCTIFNIGITDKWGAGIRFGGAANRNKALRNAIHDTGRGGIMGYESTDLIIKDNKIWDVGLAVFAITIETGGMCHRSLIENNTVDSWISVDRSDYVAVRGNTISDKTYIYAFSYCGLELAGGSNCVFTDNVVDDGQQSGISISTAAVPVEYSYFGYNTIKACAFVGSQLQGNSSAPVEKIYFYNTSFQNTTYGLHSPLYPKSEGNGIRMNTYCNNIVLDACNISGNAKLGMFLIQPGVDQLSMVNNSIQNNGGAAFVGYSGYSALEMTNNTISGNADNSAPAAASFNNNKPTAVISSVASANVGQAISFDSSSSSDSDGSIAHRLWDFGDGIPVDTTSASHAYSVAGTYRVTLIVWDNSGRAARAEKSVVVSRITTEKGNQP